MGGILTGPEQASVFMSGGRGLAPQVYNVEFFRDEPNKVYWMKKASDEVPFIRESGSARDFPFDSAVLDFDTRFSPQLPIAGILVRNANPSFYIPCDRLTYAVLGPDKVHIRFEMRRKPLVQLMAVVLLIAATLFVLIIPFSVKWDALPTSVASFFFAVWSVRGILTSEMKVFPTLFDVSILSLSVLFIMLIGCRILVSWARAGRAGHVRPS
jgi:hypothetical protein